MTEGSHRRLLRGSNDSGRGTALNSETEPSAAGLAWSPPPVCFGGGLVTCSAVATCAASSPRPSQSRNSLATFIPVQFLDEDAQLPAGVVVRIEDVWHASASRSPDGAVQPGSQCADARSAVDAAASPTTSDRDHGRLRICRVPVFSLSRTKAIDVA